MPLSSSIVGFENNENYFQGYFRRQELFFSTLSILTAKRSFFFLAVVKIRLMKLVLELIRDVGYYFKAQGYPVFI